MNKSRHCLVFCLYICPEWKDLRHIVVTFQYRKKSNKILNMIALITKFFLLMLNLISGIGALFCTSVTSRHEQPLLKKSDSVLVITSEKQTLHQKNAESSVRVL